MYAFSEIVRGVHSCVIVTRVRNIVSDLDSLPSAVRPLSCKSRVEEIAVHTPIDCDALAVDY